MTTWSRSQSQNAGGQRAIGASSNVKCTTHLVRDAKVMAANVKENKRIARWAEEAADYKKVREYRETITVVLPRRMKRGTSGCRVSPALKLELARRRVLNAAFRENVSSIAKG